MRDFMGNGKAYRDVDLRCGSSDTDNTESGNVVFLKALEYLPSQLGIANTQTFYTTFPPDCIFTKLTETLKGANTTWKIKGPNWRINFNIEEQMNADLHDSDDEESGQNFV